MPLPSTVWFSGYEFRDFPPVKSSGGGYYVLAWPAGTKNHLRVFKAPSNDPESNSWVAQDTANEPNIGEERINNWRAIQIGDVLHITCRNSTFGGDSNEHNLAWYIRFDMSTDTWSARFPISLPQLGSVNPMYVTLDRRSNGDLIVLGRGANETLMGTARERVSYAKSTNSGSTWGTPVNVGTTGVKRDIYAGGTKVGASNRIHFTFLDNFDIRHRSLNSSDTLDTAATIVTVGSGNLTTRVFSKAFTTVVDGGTTYIKCIVRDDRSGSSSNVQLSVAEWVSQANPSFTIRNFTDSDTTTGGFDGHESYLAIDPETLKSHTMFNIQSPLRLARDEAEHLGNFGTDTVLFQSFNLSFRAANNVYVRNGRRKLAFLYNSGSTETKYDEIDLGASSEGGPPEPLPPLLRRLPEPHVHLRL